MSGHTPWSQIKRPGTARPHHVFTIEPDGTHWLVRARDLERVFTQVWRPEDAVEMARSVTALMLEVDPESFDIEIVTADQAV